MTKRELPTRGAGPVGITATHDDTVWFTAILADKIGRIPMNDAIQEMDLPGKPHAVVADPDGGVWVSLWGTDQIARVSADGEVYTIDLPARQRTARDGRGPRRRTLGGARSGLRPATAHQSDEVDATLTPFRGRLWAR